MARLTPIQVQRRVCSAVEAAEAVELRPEDEAVIPADLIRRLALHRPLKGEKEARTLTPFGIRIVGATIEGRIRLDNATPRHGRPVCPIEFQGCLLDGGFSGAHAHFSRLSFRDCTFRDRKGPEGSARPIPTIDLSGAAIDSDLHMAGISPTGIGRDSVRPRGRGNHLWIRLVGARVDGEIDLCRSHLRAPVPSADRLLAEHGENALDLTQAEVKGDLQLVGGTRCEGRIKLRTAVLAGDARMSGARIESLAGEEALSLQGTRIGGFLMLNGDFDDVGDRGPFRKFRCMGTLRLEAVEIGRSLHLEQAVVQGNIEAPQIAVRDDLRLHAKVSGSIDLSACRIGGALDLARLNLARTASWVNLRDGKVGRALKVGESSLPYQLVKTRLVELASLPGLWLVETLWRLRPDERGEPGKDENGEEVPMRRRLVQAAFLVGDWSSLQMRVYHLDGHSDVLDRAIQRYRHRIDRSTAVEYARLHGAYVLAEEGYVRILGGESAVEEEEGEPGALSFHARAAIAGRIERRRFTVRIREVAVEGSRPGDPPRAQVEVGHVRGGAASVVQEDPRWFLNGLVVPPPLPAEAMAARVVAEDWLAPAALEGMADFNPSPQLMERIAHHVESVPLLQACFDLEGLSCDMLDDRGGRAWGEHFDRIRMNHFVYRRASWAPQAKSSSRYLRDRVKGARADWLWLPTPGRWTQRLREESDYLEPWQVRRNWIYRHFTPLKRRDLISISRYRIPEADYRSQPFEQAILVARAEGREDFAARFEMLKSHNEWRFFNERVRWWLGPIAITLASLWLLYHGGSPELTIPAWALTLWMMTEVTWFAAMLRGPFPNRTVRRAAWEILFYGPALILLVADGWLDRPFHFILAFLIYLGIRLAGTLCHGVMWFGFGYLRRPVRAIVTLLVAFLVGWGGVLLAKDQDMLVIEAAAVAGFAAPQGGGQGDEALLMGSQKIDYGPSFVHEPPCDPILIEPLYALDTLIPLVDLDQESRCGVRRVPEHRSDADAGKLDLSKPISPQLGGMSGSQLSEALPMLLRSNRFWWWMQALYAIAGWFLVSLALLTFTQVNRTRGEGAGMGE